MKHWNLLLEIQGNRNVKVLVGIFYTRSNSAASNNAKLIALLQKLVMQYHCKMLILGDFNLPNIVWDSLRILDKGSVEVKK